MSKVLAYAHGEASGAALVYILGQSNGASASGACHLTVLNSTGSDLAEPYYLPIRVDQFTGTVILDPDGVTGWYSASGGLKLASMRLDVPSATWELIWRSPTRDEIPGALAMFAAAHTNGSSVVVGCRLAWSRAI